MNNILFSKAKPKSLFSWALFDWANSAFPTLITTFIFATYFSEKIATNKDIGTSQWGLMIGISGIIIAIISPILGAIADHMGDRKPWLAGLSLLTIVTAAMLWFVQPHPSYVLFALLAVGLGTIGLEVGMVFYNSMLDDLVPKSHTGRLSGWAWGLGYFGGIASLAFALYALFKDGNAVYIRWCGPLTAAWFLLFGWPVFAFTPDRARTTISYKQAIKLGLTTVINTFKHLRKHREIFKFIVARMLYIDGVNTIFAFGGIYAAGTFGMSFAEVIRFGISMNVAAGIGAIAFAWLDDYIGAKPTVLISIVIMVGRATGTLLVHDVRWFWLLALGLSICFGPVQAASRSLMVHIAPPELMTEMFGLYALSGKITSFIGPTVLSFLTFVYSSQRIGMSTVVYLLALGGIVLMTVQVKQNKYTAA